MLPISERVDDADGKFLGVLIFWLAPGYLTRLHSAVDLGEGGTLALIGLDNVVRVRFSKASSEGKDGIGKSIEDDSRPGTIPEGGRGYYIRKSVIDGVARLYAYQRLDSYPLVVTVGLDLRAALVAPYRRAGLIAVLAFIGTLLPGQSSTSS